MLMMYSDIINWYKKEKDISQPFLVIRQSQNLWVIDLDIEKSQDGQSILMFGLILAQTMCLPWKFGATQTKFIIIFFWLFFLSKHPSVLVGSFVIVPTTISHVHFKWIFLLNFVAAFLAWTYFVNSTWPF
jgi:hypothetical protein